MSARPAHLHVVNPATGEAETCCADCVGLERELRGKRRKITELENELRDRHARDPERDAVRRVLDYFARRAVETGWWKETPRFEVGDERWGSVSARMKQGRTVADCLLAIEGALSQDRRGVKRAYVDVTSVFRNNANFERAFEHAMDPNLDRAGRHVRVVPAALLARWDELVSLADVCDCGHIRWDHDKPSLERPDPPCRLCDCLGFDDFHVTVERFIAERERITPCG